MTTIERMKGFLVSFLENVYRCFHTWVTHFLNGFLIGVRKQNYLCLGIWSPSRAGKKKKAKWKPPKHISVKEVVGRRTFGSKVFDRSAGTTLHFRIDVFMDSRPGTGLSGDRLGVRAAQQEVLQFLYPLCDDMATKGATTFVGWAQISAKDLRGTIRATISTGEDNPYHAEIDRSKHPTEESLRSLAFELCVHASKQEFIDRRPVADDHPNEQVMYDC